MRRFVTAVLLLALAGFVLATPKPEPTPEERAATEGFFILRLVNNVSMVTVHFAQFDRVSVEQHGKTQTFSAINGTMPIMGPGQSTLVFGGWLAPGKYRVKELGAMMGGLSTSASVHETLPEFEIAAGTLTDLGLVVVQPVGDGNALMLPAPDAAPTDRLLQRGFPTEAAAFAGKTATRWNSLERWGPNRFVYGGTDMTSGYASGLVMDLINYRIDKDQVLKAQARWKDVTAPEELLRLAKASTFQLNSPAIMSDGTMIFGSALGQILRRSPAGVWDSLDTAQLAEISSVTLLDSEMLVGTESGELLRSVDGGKSFESRGAIADGGRVLDVRRISPQEWLVATRRLEGGIAHTNVYVGPAPTSLPATASKTVSQQVTPGFWKGVVPFAKPTMGKGVYLLSLQGVEVNSYDLATRIWQQSAVKREAAEVMANSSGNVLYSSKRFSIDDGRTWTDFKAPGMSLYLTFFDSSAGAGLFGADALSWAGAQEIKVTNDGGKTWSATTKVSGSPCDIRTLRANDVLKRLVCVFRDGSIYSAGTTGPWVLERAVY